MAKVTWIVGRRVPRLYCLTPLPRRRTNSQSPTHTPGTSCHCHAFIRVCGRLCRLVPRRLLRLGISAPAPTRTPPRGARPHDTHSLAPHPRTRGPTHPHTHAFITFHALLHLLGMPPPPHRPITRWKQIGIGWHGNKKHVDHVRCACAGPHRAPWTCHDIQSTCAGPPCPAAAHVKYHR